MNRCFKIAVHFLFTLGVHAAGTEVPKIHKPWLENKPAKVLTLECKPPGGQLVEPVVYNLRLLASLSEWNHALNKTLANVMRNEKPSKGRDTEDITRVMFEGTWDRTLSLKLSVVMPLTSRDYGDYFCTASYKLKSSDDGFKLYSTRVVVDKSSFSESSDNLKVTITEADNVTVTWQPPDQDDSKFTKAEVSLTSLDKIGRVTALKPLFVTNGSAGMTFDVGVLLARFHREPEGNSSISVYLNSKLCRPFCDYMCDVSYPSCVASGAHLCTCSEALPVAMTATAETDYKTLFIVFCVLFCVFFCVLFFVTIPIIVNLVKKTKRKHPDYTQIPDKDKHENGHLDTSFSTTPEDIQHGAGGSDGRGNPPKRRSKRKPHVSNMGENTDEEVNNHKGSVDCGAPGGSQHEAGGSDGRGNTPTPKPETLLSAADDYTDKELNNREGSADCGAPWQMAGGSQHEAGRKNQPVEDAVDTMVNTSEVPTDQLAVAERAAHLQS